MALQFLQQSEEALKEANTAIKIIEARVADLEAAPAAEGTGAEEPSAGASAEAADVTVPAPEVPFVHHSSSGYLGEGPCNQGYYHSIFLRY